MVGAALSIKLRCASWQQLATIYRRDLSRGSMFLKAATQPAIGTLVRIDLELPSATVIELAGVITSHVTDPQRGTGVDLKLEPLPTKSVWLIESALAAENKMRAQSGGHQAASTTGPVPSIAEGQDVASAEGELSRALEAEADSLRKLNPFLVLGVGYETSDAAVRAAFGELTKRYHPDRFARYQSERLRQIAAEIFILIRDAYRKLADEAGRTQALGAIGKQVPARATPQPPQSGQQRMRTPAGGIPRIAVPAKVDPPKQGPHDAPTKQIVHDAPTNPSKASTEIAHTELARGDQLAIPTPQADLKSGPVRAPVSSQTPSRGLPTVAIPPAFNEKKPMTSAIPIISEGTDASTIDLLLDEGKLDEALNTYKVMSRKHPNDRVYRAGIELCEGLRSLAARDRLEAAQRFETALEIDPSNERAARELADMRRQATNERKGLLSRLMGKKEPPP
jgi:hypothetical protein